LTVWLKTIAGMIAFIDYADTVDALGIALYTQTLFDKQYLVSKNWSQ